MTVQAGSIFEYTVEEQREAAIHETQKQPERHQRVSPAGTITSNNNSIQRAQEATKYYFPSNCHPIHSRGLT